MPQQARELGALNPRVWVTVGLGVGPNRDFSEIPLVFTGVAADPIALGWVQSYTHPGGMITGNVMNAVGGEETVTQKRIGLFKQLVADLTRVGMIAFFPGAQGVPRTLTIAEKDALQKVATQFGFEFIFCGRNTIDDLDTVFAAALRDDVSALYISGDAWLSANISRIMPLVAASKKPSVGPFPHGMQRASDVLFNRPAGRKSPRRHLRREDFEGREAW
jgi:putative ABC transport system substrate-binding protein